MSIPGAIRWDAWYGQSGIAGDSENWVPGAVQATLGPQRFQSRMPWFGVPTSQYGVSINGNSQAIMDAEIGYAHAAGLQYWAYCWYTPGSSSLMNAWALHQSSTVRNNMNWCMILQLSRANTAAFWTAQTATWIGYFQQANYQQVLSGRPVLYILVDTTPFGTFAASITAFRAACVAAGLATPYIVILEGSVTAAAALMTSAGCDAISNYDAPLATSATGLVTPWTTAEPGVEAYWTSQAVASPTGVVPIAQVGWDTRPRKATGEGLTSNANHIGEGVYVTPPTGAQLTAHLQAAATYVNGNPTICPSGLVLIYSWTECDEGGNALIPTYSAGGPVLTNINAAASVIW